MAAISCMQVAAVSDHHFSSKKTFRVLSLPNNVFRSCVVSLSVQRELIRRSPVVLGDLSIQIFGYLEHAKLAVARVKSNCSALPAMRHPPNPVVSTRHAHDPCPPGFAWRPRGLLALPEPLPDRLPDATEFLVSPVSLTVDFQALSPPANPRTAGSLGFGIDLPLWSL